MLVFEVSGGQGEDHGRVSPLTFEQLATSSFKTIFKFQIIANVLNKSLIYDSSRINFLNAFFQHVENIQV